MARADQSAPEAEASGAEGAEGAEGRAAVLVCGLGTLGTECVVALRRYGVPVRAVDLVDACPEGIPFVRGDCRLAEVLDHAAIDVGSCRAVVLVTGDARANLEAALAARKSNPAIRIVARAAQDNINQLLSTLLGNFVAFEPSRLAAGALALAASTGDVVGHFRLHGRLVRVLRRQIDPEDGLTLLRALPGDLPAPLYPHQAHRLKAALEASGTTAQLRPYRAGDPGRAPV